MSGGMSMAGLKLEQAPPLSIPASFFVTAPLAVIGAGVLLLHGGSSLFWTRFGGGTLALVHLGTLGLLATVMLGALYQMIPVVAGAAVPAVRAAHGVHAGLSLAVAALAWGFATGSAPTVHRAAGLLAVVLLVFLVPVATALARAPARSATVTGMRLAVTGLALVVALGVTMAHIRDSQAAAPRYAGWVVVHLSLGLVVWIGGLITAVSFQVIPMFYLTPAFPRWAQRALVGSVAATLGLLIVALVLDAGVTWTLAAAVPGATAAWAVHPIVALRTIAKRRRKRSDPSLDFWRVGLGSALLAGPVGAAAVFANDTRWPVLFGWLVLWGWAGMIVHGMLTRIVPFLVWFHRFSKRVGHAPVPSMRALLPDALPRTGLILHVASLLLGIAAVATGAGVLARVTGLGLALTGGALLASVLRVLLARR